MTPAEYKAIKPERAKYRNTRCTHEGIRFDSLKERNRWLELQILERDGQITKLERQISFPIVINNLLICRYVADFTYIEKGENITEDVKSKFTRKLPEYRLKNKLMKAVHGIDIREVW